MSIKKIVESSNLPAEMQAQLVTAFNEAVTAKLRDIKIESYKACKARAKVAFMSLCEHLHRNVSDSVIKDSSEFKVALTEGMQDFIQAYLNKTVTEAVIVEQADARFNSELVNVIVERLTVNEASKDQLARAAIKKAVNESNQVKAQANLVTEENLALRKKLGQYEAGMAFKKATVGCTAEQKAVLAEKFNGKNAEFITKNLPSALKQILKESAGAGKAAKVITESTAQKAPVAGPSAADRKVILEKASALRKQDQNRSVINENLDSDDALKLEFKESFNHMDSANG